MLRQNHSKNYYTRCGRGVRIPSISEESVPLLLLVVLGSESANRVSVFNERKIYKLTNVYIKIIICFQYLCPYAVQK